MGSCVSSLLFVFHALCWDVHWVSPRIKSTKKVRGEDKSVLLIIILLSLPLPLSLVRLVPKYVATLEGAIQVWGLHTTNRKLPQRVFERVKYFESLALKKFASYITCRWQEIH